MTIALAPDRAFAVFERGELRDDILDSWRIGLRSMGFSEDEIATATARLSRWWTEADALDLVLQAGQARALYFADQVRPDRAGSSWLSSFHGPLWVGAKLGATGGAGTVDAVAAPGTIFVGSTTVPDPAAHQLVTPAGLRFQVLYTATADGNGDAELTLGGIDTGEQTNLLAGSKLQWSFGPVSATAEPVVNADFSGGLPEETDADYARRILRRIRHRPAAGNNAHVRSWAEDSSNAVESGFVYACAFHAGSILVCIVQKRSNVLGPLARIPSALTMSNAISYITPPASPVAPAPPHVVGVPPVAVPTDMVLSLALPRGNVGGFADIEPWPGQSAGVGTAITAVADQTHFEVDSPLALPSGATSASLMVWNETTSRFEALAVASVTNSAGTLFDVVLSQAPVTTLAVGQLVSPDTRRRVIIAETIEDYFDGLGPGEVIDLASDTRSHRAYRFPEPAEEYPQRAGSQVEARLADALGPSLGDSILESASQSTPAIPAEVISGPSMLVLGKIGVYPL